MKLTQIREKIVSIFKSKGIFRKNKVFEIDNKTYLKKENFTKDLRLLFENAYFLQENGFDLADLKKIKDVLEDTMAHDLPEKKLSSSKKDPIDFLPDRVKDEFVNNYTLVHAVDLPGKEQVFLYHKKRKILISRNTPKFGLSFDSLCDYFPNKNWVNQFIYEYGENWCIVYEPSQEVPKYKKLTTKKFKVGNLYEPPEYLFLPPPQRIGVPRSFSKFIKAFLPDKKSRQVALSWLHHALLDKAHGFLMIVGPQGTGKGTFSRIHQALFGHHNSELLSTDSFLSSRFHNFRYKRYLYLDELEAKSNKEINKVKLLAENEILTETKGKDAIRSKNHLSVFITSNDYHDIRIEPDERRFSIINCSEERLTKSYGAEAIDGLFEDLNNEHYLNQLYHGLINYTPAFDKYYVHQEEAFENCVVANAANGFTQLVDDFFKPEERTYDEIKYSDLRKAFERDKKKNPHTKKMKSVINAYTYLSKMNYKKEPMFKLTWNKMRSDFTIRFIEQ